MKKLEPITPGEILIEEFLMFVDMPGVFPHTSPLKAQTQFFTQFFIGSNLTENAGISII